MRPFSSFATKLGLCKCVSSITTPPPPVQASDDSQKLPTSQIPNSTTAPAPNTSTRKLEARDIKQAYKRIQGIVQRSPLDFSPRLSSIAGCQLYLKKEHISITGSYKERGALNKLLQLTDEEKKRGVICSSAGNHAQAVSYHSTRLGISSVIVMPLNAPHVKVKAVREFGGRVVQAGESFAEAYQAACEIAAREGRTFIHAFNDSEIVAGQGTVAMELIEQNPYLDAVIVPVGGGGLIAGMSMLIKSVNPRIKVFGVESVAMPGVKRSLEAGRVISVPKRPSMADGIAIENIGPVPFQMIQSYVDDVVLVDEDEIAMAVLELLEREKTVVEGSGGVALAAVLNNKLPIDDIKDKQVAIVTTGGNIDMSLLSRIIKKGLVKTGRLARIRLQILDIPGQLGRVCSIITECRANIQDIEHERAFLLANVGITQPIVTLETRGFDHVQEIVEKLSQNFDHVRLGQLSCMIALRSHSFLDRDSD